MVVAQIEIPVNHWQERISRQGAKAQRRRKGLEWWLTPSAFFATLRPGVNSLLLFSQTEPLSIRLPPAVKVTSRCKLSPVAGLSNIAW
jgi:hypothetical protein